MNNTEFWKALDALVESSDIIIDRHRGSRHPKYTDIIYPLDYGYLGNTISSDGEGVDVFLGSGSDRALRAVLVSVDLEKRDSEIKLLLGLTEAEPVTVYNFYNDYPGMSALLIRRGEDI